MRPDVGPRVSTATLEAGWSCRGSFRRSSSSCTSDESSLDEFSFILSLLNRSFRRVKGFSDAADFSADVPPSDPRPPGYPGLDPPTLPSKVLAETDTRNGLVRRPRPPCSIPAPPSSDPEAPVEAENLTAANCSRKFSHAVSERGRAGASEAE